ncbi:ATP-binding protein [Archangium lansingense]|uniref:histidine kinase n=1 Tax=Archangium lansingense TaxID=2995310 RepID=A0ABT4A8Q9_9BACT|nr:ATP-binding protein [Archangium lansinium]MCY1077981.1 ATP-binding protein [Archangium lansinium]
MFEKRARHGQEQEALAQQTARAHELATALGYPLHASEQLLDTLAALASPIQGKHEVEDLLRRMLASGPTHMVYGLGLWFEPGQFEPGVHYMGPYVYQDRSRRGAPQVITYDWSTSSYDYPRQGWYLLASQRGGLITVTEPYFDLDQTYVALTRAFFDDQGRQRGVVSLDLTLPMIGEVVRQANVSPAETLYLVSPQGALIAHPREKELLAWAHKRGRSPLSIAELTLEDLQAWEREHGLDRERRTTEVRVPTTGWRVFASTTEDMLFSDVRRERWLLVALGVLLWMGLGASGMVMARSERTRALLRTLAERQRQEEERRRLLAQVRRRSAELQAIIESMVEAVMVVDAERNITLANRAALALFGYSSFEGHRLDTEFQEHSPQGLDGQELAFESLPLLRALKGEEVIDTEFVLTLPPLNRMRVVRVNAAPIRDESGLVVAAVAVGRDVTQAIELERLQSEFVKMAAHELKTPLAVMKSFAQLACRTAHPAPVLRRQLEGISRGADRMDRVVRTLLDASQLQLGRLHFEKKELRLRSLVETAAALTAAHHPRHPIHVQPGPDAWVLGDRARLEQVLSELMDNAARYSVAGTPVEIALTVDGGEVEVSIRDEGIGISEEQRERLFERFYRAHAGTPHDRGGMGLGLYLSRGLLLLHGGEVELESQAGKGTHVRVRLPRLPEQQPVPEVTSRQAPTHPPFEPDGEAAGP